MSQSQITIDTLQNVLNIINIVSKRGAIHGEELELVGRTYNEIKNFIIEATEANTVKNQEIKNQEIKNTSNHRENTDDNTTVNLPTIEYLN